MCTIAGYLASAGEGLNRGERGAASLCMPHPYRWWGAGWQRDGGPSWLFGLPGDGHLSPVLHGCPCHYLHSARFLFKCWGTFFPLQVCAAWTRRRKHQRSGHLGHLFNFLFTRGAIQRSMRAQEQSLLHTQLQKCCPLTTYRWFNYTNTF